MTVRFWDSARAVWLTAKIGQTELKTKKGDPKAAFFELRSKLSFGQCLELNAHVYAVKVKVITFSAVKLCLDALAESRG